MTPALPKISVIIKQKQETAQLDPKCINLCTSPRSSVHLSKVIIPINPNILQFCEILEMQWTMKIIVESRRCVDFGVDGFLFHGAKATSHETVVPDAVIGNQEVPSNLVAE